MKYSSKCLAGIVCLVVLASCRQPEEISSINPENWKKRAVAHALSDSLETGTTYLAVYSHIYGFNEHRTFDLSATISMRNTDRNDTVYILHAEYYNTAGELIRTYFKDPIYLAPMETAEIIIDEVDQAGGSGANFMFDWKIRPGSHEPYFESVMISASGHLGMAFSTRGVRVE